MNKISLNGVTKDFDSKLGKLMELLEDLDIAKNEMLRGSRKLDEISELSSKAKTETDLAFIAVQYKDLEEPYKLLTTAIKHTVKEIREVAGELGDIKETYWEEHVYKYGKKARILSGKTTKK